MERLKNIENELLDCIEQASNLTEKGIAISNYKNFVIAFSIKKDMEAKALYRLKNKK